MSEIQLREMFRDAALRNAIGAAGGDVATLLPEMRKLVAVEEDEAQAYRCTVVNEHGKPVGLSVEDLARQLAREAAPPKKPKGSGEKIGDFSRADFDRLSPGARLAVARKAGIKTLGSRHEGGRVTLSPEQQKQAAGLSPVERMRFARNLRKGA